MTDDLLEALPARQGHFLLESGLHTDWWLTLDALFVSPRDIAPQIAALAELLRPHAISAVCGPLLGGAFLAHAVAAHMCVRFYYCQPAPAEASGGLFSARYRLPAELRRRVRNERVAVVDDVISAGSSVRATAAELAEAGATTVVVGSLLLLENQKASPAAGPTAVEHFAALGVPVVAVGRRGFNLWSPDECPLCRTGTPLEDPR